MTANEKRRVEIAKPRSFVETLRQFLKNPLNIMDQDVAETMPISLMLFFGASDYCCAGSEDGPRRVTNTRSFLTSSSTERFCAWDSPLR